MTPALFAEIRPYLTALGTGRIDVNGAPAPVLRAIPGITDDVVARIMSARATQRRIRTIAEIMPARTSAALQAQIARRVTFNASELLLTIDVVDAVDARPQTLRAVVQRNDAETGVSWVSW
jgi:type II secretory pathway component PulK